MSSNAPLKARRLFGGSATQEAGRYDRPMLNTEEQATPEVLAVGTHRRVFPGSRMGSSHVVSLQVYVSSAGGAASTLKFYVSNLPAPDPTNAAHWALLASPASLDLTATGGTASSLNLTWAWAKAEAVVAVSSCSLFAYARSPGVDE